MEDAFAAAREGVEATAAPTKPELTVPIKAEPHIAKTEPVVKGEPAQIIIDPDEAALIAKFRAEKAAKLLSLQSPDVSNSNTSLQVTRKPDGSLSLTPRSIKAEASTVPPAPPAPGFQDLDEHSKAAIAALAKRAAAKKSDKAGVKVKAEEEVTVAKRPAAKAEDNPPKKIKTEPAANAGAKPPTKQTKVKDEPKEVSKAGVMKAMPRTLPSDGSNPPPVLYKGGILYTSRKAMKFRALTEKGNKYSETQRSWGGDKPSKDAWQSCVTAIEKHQRKR